MWPFDPSLSASYTVQKMDGYFAISCPFRYPLLLSLSHELVSCSAQLNREPIPISLISFLCRSFHLVLLNHFIGLPYTDSNTTTTLAYRYIGTTPRLPQRLPTLYNSVSKENDIPCRGNLPSKLFSPSVFFLIPTNALTSSTNAQRLQRRQLGILHVDRLLRVRDCDLTDFTSCASEKGSEVSFPPIVTRLNELGLLLKEVLPAS
jgi:hypothetical protein